LDLTSLFGAKKLQAEERIPCSAINGSQWGVLHKDDNETNGGMDRNRPWGRRGSFGGESKGYGSKKSKDTHPGKLKQVRRKGRNIEF